MTKTQSPPYLLALGEAVVVVPIINSKHYIKINHIECSKIGGTEKKKMLNKINENVGVGWAVLPGHRVGEE